MGVTQDARSCIEALERLADATQKRLVSCKKRLEATGGSLSDATASSMEAQRLYSQRGSHPRVLMAMPAEKLHERDLGLELECRVFGSRVTLETCRRSAAESKRMNFFADVKRKPDEEEVTSELIELALEMKKKAAEQSQHLSIDKELMDHILDSQTANLDHTGQANKQASQLLGLPGGSLLSVVYAVLNTSLGVVGETAKLVLASYLFVTLLFPKGLYYFVWLGGLASVLLLLSWKVGRLTAALAVAMRLSRTLTKAAFATYGRLGVVGLATTLVLTVSVLVASKLFMQA